MVQNNLKHNSSNNIWKSSAQKYLKHKS
jgi:hypothetical protein